MSGLLGLQASVVQASPSQTATPGAAVPLAMHSPAINAPDGHPGFATKPMAGRLTAKDVDGQINIRKQPSVRSPILSPGLNQDPLYIFKSALTPQGQLWYFVENVPTGEQGWVHGDYVRLNEPGKRFPEVSAEVMPIDPMTGEVNWDMPHAVAEQPEAGIITARDVGAWVNGRSQPSTMAPIRHTARPGDAIYIYRTAQLSAPAGRGRVNELWYFVAFLDSGAEGWVNSDFVESAWESDEPFEVVGFGPRPGQLKSLDRAAQIRLYRDPSEADNSATGQGQPGEAVMLLRKLETPRGNLERTWYWVRLASGQEGWVKGPNVVE